ARVLPVLHLDDGAERPVEAEIRRNRVDDLLQRGRDDVDLLPALMMLLDEVERLGVDERPKNRLHRLRDELTELLWGVAGEDLQAVLRRAAHGLMARAAG